MQAWWSSPNVKPCKGSPAAMTGKAALLAPAVQRTTPAIAESVTAPADPNRFSNGLPAPVEPQRLLQFGGFGVAGIERMQRPDAIPGT
jgi:hypothetical protein